MKSQIFLPLLSASILGLLAPCNMSCSSGSRLQTVAVDAPSLQANMVGVSAIQPAHVYLPPSYDRSQRRYPVLYFLPGYDDPHWIFTGGALQGFRLRDAMDQLIALGLVKELIVVIPTSATSMGGTFYANSPVLGSWEDYIVRDLVGYVDGHFRTLPVSQSRAVTGTTVGATGALTFAMRYPNLFSAVYALDPVLLSPGAFGPDGLFSPDRAQNYLALQEAWEKLPSPRARLARTIYLQSQLCSSSGADRMNAFFLTMAAAYSPDTSRRGLPVRLPFQFGAGGIIPDPAALKAFESGLGDWETKVIRYGPNLNGLRLLALDYGVDTEARWLPMGCQHLDALFAAAGIPHETRTHRGNYDSQFRSRMEGFLLPAVSKALQAENMP